MENNIGKEILKAISDFQEDCPILYKDSNNHRAQYVNLTTVTSTIKPLLRKHGLTFTQFLTGVSINTTIYHIETAQYISASFEIPEVETPKGMNGYQNVGSGITYIRRYALCSALNIIADADKEASGLVKDLSEYIEELQKCSDLKELENLYKGLSSTVKKSNKVVSAFAKRKKELG